MWLDALMDLVFSGMPPHYFEAFKFESSIKEAGFSDLFDLARFGLMSALPEALKIAGQGYVDLMSATGKPWSLQAIGDLSDEYEKAKLVSSLNALGNPFPAEEIEKEFGIEQLWSS